VNKKKSLKKTLIVCEIVKILLIRFGLTKNLEDTSGCFQPSNMIIFRISGFIIRHIDGGLKADKDF
jgi:hypothetical protein